MAAQKSSLELLPKEDWEKGSLGKILKWTLSVGRYIVIVTELIVILAFLSRFKLDRDLTDLNEDVRRKQAVVTAFSSFEENFRLLQKKITTIENLETTRFQTTATLSVLSSLVPVDVYLSDLSVSPKDISLTATSLSEAGLGTFIKNLKSSNKFSQLSLSGISSGAENEIGIKFSLKGEFK